MNNASLYLVTILIWGSTWLAIEFQLGVVPPEVSVVYRYFAASTLLFVWCRWRKLPLRFGWREHLRFAALGVLLFGVGYAIAYRAQVYISGALTAIGFSTLLWMNLINSRIFFGVRPRQSTVLGAVVGVVGIAVLFAPQIGEVSWADDTLVGMVLVLCGAALASFGNMVSQSAQQAGLPVVQSNAWGMAYGAATAALIALASGRQFMFDPSPSYILSLAYLVLFGSIIAFGAYLTLLGRIGAHRAGYATVAFPVVATVLGVFFEGVQVVPSMLFGMTLVVMGNILVLRRPSASRSEPAPAVNSVRIPASAKC